jgi:hypothetical protein
MQFHRIRLVDPPVRQRRKREALRHTPGVPRNLQQRLLSGTLAFAVARRT